MGGGDTKDKDRALGVKIRPRPDAGPFVRGDSVETAFQGGLVEDFWVNAMLQCRNAKLYASRAVTVSARYLSLVSPR